MPEMILGDIREYVFPLLLGADPATLPAGTPIACPDKNYLGTAFFITRNGIALTAAHCVPPPESVPPGQALLAGVWANGRAWAAVVQAATIIPNYDVAILKVSTPPAQYLPLSFVELIMGHDVYAVGIPEHSVSGQGKEFRCLKGHVTFEARFLELSFAAPRGMSGSPVFYGDRVVAVLSGNAKSEALEDQVEETTIVSEGRTVVRRVETKAVVNYGLAESLAKLGAWSHEITEGEPFERFVARLNARAD
jgi:hypothetical protein